MKIGIIILNWNSGLLIDQCLRGLLDHESHPVYVVDNGSSDGSADLVANKYPQVTLIRSPGNLGFAEGNNVGIRRALQDGCDAVFLLNNDTIIDEPFIGVCAQMLENDSKLGIVGPVIVEGDKPHIVQCCGGKTTLWNLSFTFRRRGQPYVKRDICEVVDWVLGAGMLIRKDVFDKSGGLLDPEYFPAYVEEADLCYRAKKAGYLSAIHHGARVRHIGSQSAGSYQNVFRRMMVNRFLFAVKHLGLFRFMSASAIIVSRVFIEKLMAALHRYLPNGIMLWRRGRQYG